MSNRKKSHKNPARQVRAETLIPYKPDHKLLAGMAIIALIAVLAYLPSINGWFIMDDDLLLTENELIKAPDGLCKFWFSKAPADYWPVTNTMLWLEWRLYGMKPAGYHITSLILHVVEALLVWLILRKLSVPGAFLAGLIFAVHPVNVESVAWIAQQKNMFAMLFFLLSVLCYLKFLKRARPRLAAKQIPSSFSSFHLWYWLSLAMFILAMLGKGSVVFLPVLLLGIVWWMRGVTKWDLMKTMPFFLVALALGSVNVWFQTHGTEIVIRNATFTERLLGAGGVIWFYLYKAIFPLDLVFIYAQWHIQVDNPLWWLPLSAAVAVTLLTWQFRRIWGRHLLFGWGFFCVALVPVLGFTDVGFMKYSLVADHYQHIAIIGVIALAAAGLNLWRMQALPTVRRTATAATILAVATLGFLTWRQNILYANRTELYRATVEKNPACWIAHNNLGKALYETGSFAEAIDHYKKALLLKTDYPEVYYNLGLVMFDQNHTQEAIELYQKALQFKSNLPEAHNNLGLALFKTGRTQEAIEHYRQALQIKANYPDARNNLGTALNSIGRLQDAIEQIELAVELKPDFADAHFNLGLVLAKSGRLPDAIDHYQQAVRLNPGDSEAYYYLALAYAETNRSPEAIKATLRALKLARSQGKTAQVKKMEDWLDSYRSKIK